MDSERSENYVDEVLKLPERLYLRDKGLHRLLILDRHIIQVNISQNQCLCEPLNSIGLFRLSNHTKLTKHVAIFFEYFNRCLEYYLKCCLCSKALLTCHKVR